MAYSGSKDEQLEIAGDRPVLRCPRVSLVLPLYNEADGVCEIVSGLVRAFERGGLLYELVLVNNGSVDQTASVLDEIGSSNEAVRIVNVPVNEGYGWGIISGLREASGDIVGFMCGDGQIDPADVVRVCRRLLDEELDLCKVVRVTREDGFRRRVMSSCYNVFFRILFPMERRDINGTPKLMRRWCYEQFRLVSKDWFIDAEIMIKAVKSRYRIGEVAVTFKARERGSSNVRLGTSFEFLRNMVRYWFLEKCWSRNLRGRCEKC